VILTCENSGIQQFSNDLRLTKIWSPDFDQKLKVGVKFLKGKPLSITAENQLIQWQTQSSPEVLINQFASCPALSFIIGDGEFFILLQNASILRVSKGKGSNLVFPPKGDVLCFYSTSEFIAFTTSIDEQYLCVIFHPGSAPKTFALPERPEDIWVSGAHQTLIVKFTSSLQFFRIQSNSLYLTRTHDIPSPLIGCITPSHCFISIHDTTLSLWSLSFAEIQSSTKITISNPVNKIICLSNETHCIASTDKQLLKLEMPQSTFTADLAQVIANVGAKSVPDYTPFVKRGDWAGLKEFLVHCENPGKMNLPNLCQCLMKNQQKVVLLAFLSECNGLQEEDVVVLLNYSLPKDLSLIYVPLLSRIWTKAFVHLALPGLSSSNLHKLLDFLLRDREQVGVEKVVWWLNCATDTLGLHIDRPMLTRVQEYLKEMHSQLKRINSLRSKIMDLSHPRKKQKLSHYSVQYMLF